MCFVILHNRNEFNACLHKFDMDQNDCYGVFLSLSPFIVCWFSIPRRRSRIIMYVGGILSIKSNFKIHKYQQ